MSPSNKPPTRSKSKKETRWSPTQTITKTSQKPNNLCPNRFHNKTLGCSLHKTTRDPSSMGLPKCRWWTCNSNINFNNTWIINSKPMASPCRWIWPPTKNSFSTNTSPAYRQTKTYTCNRPQKIKRASKSSNTVQTKVSTFCRQKATILRYLQLNSIQHKDSSLLEATITWRRCGICAGNQV